MSATVIRLATRERAPDISRHLVGRCHQRVGSDMLSRMQGESAIRSFIRRLARRTPMSDYSTGEDVWQQVEDIVALVPGATASTGELEAFAHAVRSVLCVRRPHGLAVTQGNLARSVVKISAVGSTLRVGFVDSDGGRVLTFRLTNSGARRIDDVATGR